MVAGRVGCEGDAGAKGAKYVGKVYKENVSKNCMGVFDFLKKKKKSESQIHGIGESMMMVELEKNAESGADKKSEDTGKEIIKFAEVISRLTTIQEQMAREKTLSDGLEKIDRSNNDLFIYVQREFEKLGNREKEDVIKKSDRLILLNKSKILCEKICQALTNQRLTFTGLERELTKSTEFSFSRGLFSKNLQELFDKKVVLRENNRYFLPSQQSVL